MLAPVVSTHGLTCQFDDRLAVDSVDLSIAAGEIVGLLGANGAGKSTTIKMLTTILAPSRGTATVAGFDIDTKAADVRRHIGYVPQLVSADPALTGAENLRLSAHLYDVPWAQVRPRVTEALAFCELTDAENRLVKTYSGGMIRRLELAQAMLHRPEVLFLDEPTIGLDPMARHAVWDRLRALQHERQMAILITTHDMEEADNLCDRLYLMQNGKISATGTPAELKARVGINATLDSVFAYFCGAAHDGGSFGDVQQSRSASIRHG